MLNFLKQFDSYSLNARLKPALLVLFPAIVTTATIFPDLYGGIGPTIVSLAGTCGVLALLSRISRHRGRLLEQVLYAKWNGMPTTAWMRHSDENLDPITKRRYHTFLASHISKLKMPSPTEESANPDEADQKYRSATKWLLEYTRDKKKFPLVYDELVNYGFQRNTLAMKPVAIVISLLCSAVIGAQIYRIHGTNLAAVDADQILSALISIAALIIWIFAVTESWVKDAANAYTRALFSACEK